MSHRWVAANVAAIGFIFSVLMANYLTTRYGFVPVGFGFTATAGTFAAGFALASRDVLQDTMGRIGVIVLILFGAILSFGVADARIAVASGVAFLVSEVADMIVYTPIRDRARFGDRWWASAVTVSNIVGAVVDTVIFLTIAFGVATVKGAITGQLVGKMEVTVVFVIVGAVIAHAVFRQPDRVSA